MADAEDSRDEESWLYGDSVTLPTSDIKKEPGVDKPKDDAKPVEPLPPGEAPNGNSESHEGTEPGELKDDEPPGEPTPQENDASEKPKKGGEEGGEEEEEDDDDDSEDDVHVTIGDIKTAPQYSNLNIKRGAQLSSGLEKLNKQAGKFSIEEFESIGTINGVPAHEFSIDALDEKPWRKPGADITDYFNYGFNEDTWRAYCERQKQMRVHESGIGLGGLGVSRGSALTVVNENSKYASTGSAILVGGINPGAQRKGGAPTNSRRAGVIDVIGSVNSRRNDISPPKENPIQVMTGENRRDYNRKSFDMSVPPPGFEAPPPMPMVPNYPSHGGYNQDYYNPAEMDPYYGAYEPSQDMQWSGQMMNQVWSSRHRDKKSHSSSHSNDSKRTKYSRSNSMSKDIEVPGTVTVKQEPPEKSSKEREREREARHKERHRHRSRSRSGDRSERERSERRRKHKSRSRSPGHRSHKKKKSKKSDRSKEGSD